jgi:hypothetical protein
VSTILASGGIFHLIYNAQSSHISGPLEINMLQSVAAEAAGGRRRKTTSRPSDKISNTEPVRPKVVHFSALGSRERLFVGPCSLRRNQADRLNFEVFNRPGSLVISDTITSRVALDKKKTSSLTMLSQKIMN